MDKYEFSMKLDELKRLAANGQFRKAGKVLEAIDIKKIKNIKELYVVIDILIENEKYDQATELLAGISRKLKSRRVFHQLVDVSIKSKNTELALKYMKEFYKLAPKDSYNYVFQYQLAAMMEEPYEKQIEVLENLKQYEYLEKWAYELAKVYHRAGRDDDCAAECEDLILWFGDGVYVEKAKVLKKYLTEAVIPEEIQEAGRRADRSQSSWMQQSDEYLKVDVAKTMETEEIKSEIYHEPEAVPQGRSSQPAYQRAFDFIEDMEMREKEEELDRIIEAANQKKLQAKSEAGYDEAAKAEQELPQQSENDDVVMDQIPASDKEVKRLVEDTTDLIASQLSEMFFPEENGQDTVSETETVTYENKQPDLIAQTVPENEAEQIPECEPESTIEAEQEELSEPETYSENNSDSASLENDEQDVGDTTGSDIVEDIQAGTEIQEEMAAKSDCIEAVEENMKEERQSEDIVISAIEEKDDSADEADITEDKQSVTEQPGEAVESFESVAENELSDANSERASEEFRRIKEGTRHLQNEEHQKNKSDVLEDVDQLIKKRRQRATTKQLNAEVQKVLGEDAEAKEYLGQFAKMHVVGEEILRSLEILTEAHNNNTVIVIAGQTTFCQTFFSRKLAKLLCAMNLIETQKFVLLSYEKFLGIDFEKHLDQIQGGCIVIEEVTEVTEKMQQQIALLVEQRCFIIAEQAPEQQTASVKESLELIVLKDQNHIQSIEIQLQEFDDEDLIGFAEEFLEEKEYSLEEDARNYLMSYAKELSSHQDADAFCKVLEKITKAYHCANQRNKVELRNIAELGNYQDAAFMSIKCTDFADEN